MLKSLQKGNFSFEYLLILFILLQPFIDLLTSLSIFAFEINLTFGIFIRFGVMFLILVYIFMSRHPYKKPMIIYLFIFGASLLIGVVLNFLLKDGLAIFSEARNIAKIAYFPIVLFGYVIVMEKIKENHDLKEKIVKNIFYSLLVVTAVMVISTITGTGIKSYESIKLGHQGWFFAGNEVGAIMAINFGLIMIYSIRKTKTWKDIYFWIPVAMAVFSLLVLGTKVGYGAPLVILVVALVMNVYDYLRSKKRITDIAPFKVNTILSLVFLVVFILSTPFTPVASNMNIHLGWVGLDEEHGEEDEEAKEKEKKAVENVLFSGREEKLALYKEEFEDVPLTQKLFGMGYGGNDAAEGYSVEMDFHDIFYSIGIIGFIIYLVPIVYFAFRIIKGILVDFGEKFNRETAFLGASVVLALGIAYMAGHVLSAPAVSFYLAVIIAYLYYVVCIKRNNYE